MSIRYQSITTGAAFKAVAQLEGLIWNASPHDTVSPHTLHAYVHNGGLVIGAYDADRLVGFVVGFPGKRGDRILLWSEMAGVHPDYQAQGIGYQLKQHQRIEALARGYEVIAWTFDPLRARNARFNFNRLGVTCYTYLVNHYGFMEDAINAGMPSDRLEAWWDLKSARTQAFVETGAEKQPDVNLESVTMLMFVDDSGQLTLDLPEVLSADVCGVEIPVDIDTLKKADIEAAKSWQLRLRQSLCFCFEQGYHIIGVITANSRTWYILRPITA